MQECENTLRERLCRGGWGPARQMGGGASGRKLEVGDQQVQSRHLLRVFSPLLSSPFLGIFLIMVVVICVILSLIPLLVMGSVVGNVS